MNCPFCSSNLNKVVDKRSVAGSGEIRRRRECLHCGKRFTTYEVLAKLQILVVKKDNRREPYDQTKLKAGLLKALEKRPGYDQVAKIIEKVEARIRLKGMREVPSGQLGKWILSDLKKIDAVAYLRFASVYHKFTEASDFVSQLKNLKDKNEKTD